MPTTQDIHVPGDPNLEREVNAHPVGVIRTEPIADESVVLQEPEAVSDQPTAELNQEEFLTHQARAEIKRSNLLALVNRPWILLTVPLLGGSIWLANNMWVITQNLDKPYMLLTGPVFVASIIIGWMLITFFRTIATGCTTAWQAFNHARKEDSSAQFFWVVILVFMLVSVFASGSFFSMLEHNSLPLLGYATALFIDLVAVQAMRARLNAVRMRDQKGAGLYLFGVLLCAGASAFANVYISLADFDQRVTGSLPPWMLHIAPWFGLVFPALILLLSVTADYTIDQISSKLDPEQYREQESKRIKLLEYQREALRERVNIETEIDHLTVQLKNKKEQRVFFLVNWLFPVRSNEQGMQPLVEEAMERLLSQFQQVDKKSNQEILTLQQTHWQAIEELRKEAEQVQQRLNDIGTDIQRLVNGWSEISRFQEANHMLQHDQSRQEDLEGPNNDQTIVNRAPSNNIVEEQKPEVTAEVYLQLFRQIEGRERKADRQASDNTIELQESAIAFGDIVPESDYQLLEQHTEELHLLEGTFLDEIFEAHVQKEGYLKEEKHISGENVQYGGTGIGQEAVVDEREKVSESVRKKPARNSGTMTFREVAKKFHTTISIVEDAVQRGDLKLSKRDQSKILVSSLSNFTPPPRRRRRVRAEEQVEEHQITLVSE